MSIRILYECASLCDCVCGSATDAKEEDLKLQLLSWARRIIWLLQCKPRHPVRVECVSAKVLSNAAESLPTAGCQALRELTILEKIMALATNNTLECRHTTLEGQWRAQWLRSAHSLSMIARALTQRSGPLTMSRRAERQQPSPSFTPRQKSPCSGTVQTFSKTDKVFNFQH
jgi:hypothetical protein